MRDLKKGQWKLSLFYLSTAIPFISMISIFACFLQDKMILSLIFTIIFIVSTSSLLIFGESDEFIILQEKERLLAENMREREKIRIKREEERIAKIKKDVRRGIL